MQEVSAPLPFDGPGRMSARTALIHEAQQLRRKADGLEELARQLPDGLPLSADEALWLLVCDATRR